MATATAAEATWYWSDGEQRNGPVRPADLARMAAAGQLRADHLVWTDGMAEWKRAGQVGGLVKYLERGTAATGGGSPLVAPAAVAPVAAPPVAIAPVPISPIQPLGGGIAYYTPGQGMPQRAATTMAKHATPRGDTGEWPLDQGNRI